MEHIVVKKKNDRSIITHKLEKAEQISSMELDIINKAEIPALLPVQIRRSLMGKAFRFVVQDHIDLRTFLKSDIRFDLFAQIISQIVDTLQSCESHGIRCGNLELSCDLSFYDHGNRQVRLIYWPLISLSATSNASSFFMELGSIYTCRSDDSSYRLRYLKFFDSRAKFDLGAFKQYLDLLLKQWKADRSGVPSGRGGGSSSKRPGDALPVAALRTASIQRVSTQATIHVSRYPFTIGRRAEFCDHAIEDPCISKRHVTILLREGQPYIRDNGSSNGTFLNGKRLPANTDVELPSGARFRIGNEELIFYAADGQ